MAAILDYYAILLNWWFVSVSLGLTKNHALHNNYYGFSGQMACCYHYD